MFFIIVFFILLLGLYVKSLSIGKDNTPDMIKDALNLSVKITENIETIREKYNADRVWITQFHNGGHFYPTGKSIAKFSVIYETVNEEVNSIQNSFKNIPVNLFSKSISQLLTNNKIIIPDYKDTTIQTYGLKYIAETTDCKSGYLFSIKSKDGKFIGTLGLDYTRETTLLSDESINNLESQASLIGEILIES